MVNSCTQIALVICADESPCLGPVGACASLLEGPSLTVAAKRRLLSRWLPIRPFSSEYRRLIYSLLLWMVRYLSLFSG